MESQSNKTTRKPSLNFKASEVAVALHVVEKIPKPVNKFKKQPAHNGKSDTSWHDHMMQYRGYAKHKLNIFKSMELDLLAYQFQKSPPMESSLPYTIDPDKSHRSPPATLTITFPKTIDFYSEGQHKSLVLKKNIIKAEVRLSWTDFPESQLRIWHFVFTPSEKDEDHFDEYSIIGLIHCYDGRSESTEIGNQVKFKRDRASKSSPECETPIKMLIDELIGDHFKKHKKHREGNAAPDLAFVAGTIQIAPQPHPQNEDDPSQGEGQATNTTLQENLNLVWGACQNKKGDEYTKLKKIYDTKNKSAENSDIWNQIKAFAGIAIGIYDFDDVDFEEMLDTLTPTISDDNIFIQMNRCTLLAFTPKDRVIAAPEVKMHIGISPYLLFPHSAIIHNEFLVDEAEKQINKIDKELNGDLQSSSLDDLEVFLDNARRDLWDKQIPNVFNYATERIIFKEGYIARGSLDKLESVKADFNDIKARIEVIWKKRADKGQIYIAALLAGFAPLSLFSSNSEKINNFLFSEIGMPLYWIRILDISLALFVAILVVWLVLRLRRSEYQSGPRPKEMPDYMDLN